MRKVALILFIVLGLSLAAGADVTIKKKMSMEMPGMPMSDMISIEQVQGDKSLNTTEFAGGMAAGQQAVSITRLDKGVMWNVVHNNKTYSEFNLKEVQAMMDQGGKGANSENEEDKYEWTYDVKKEDRKTEGGIKCQAVITDAAGVNKEDPEDKVAIHYEFWISDDVPGLDDLDAYNKRYVEVTGIDPYDQDQMVNKIGNDYNKVMKKMVANFKGLKGYPVKTVMTIRKSGMPQMPGMPEGEEMDPRAAAMMKKMMGGKAGQPSEDGMSTVFSVTAEVIDISQGTIEGSAFDIPQGYTKNQY